MHCHGSPFDFIQAQCGDVGPHDEHPYNPADKVLLGAEAGFEGDCGRPGPHDRHPASETPKES